MAGICFLVSKCSCPTYKTNAYAKRGPTSKNVGIISPRSSNPHLQITSPLQATTPLLKSRSYSTCIVNYGMHDSLFYTMKRVKDSSLPESGEKAILDATKAPVKFLLTYTLFALPCTILAPTNHTRSAWGGAFMFSFMWVLNRWKTNVLVMKMKTVDRNKLVSVDKICSAGLFVPSCIALAKSIGFGADFLSTVGGVGGVLVAFVIGDILGNVINGLLVKVSHPFSVGDTIQVGSVEGQVIEMGLATTSLLNAKGFPVKVENSLFSSEVIVNKSRVGCRPMESKIHILMDRPEKIPEILEEIMNMIRSNPTVYLKKEQPYCKASRMEGSSVELSIRCHLKMMSKDMLFSGKQDVLLQSVQILKKHGATLAGT